jgi:hypothetical protein
VPPCSTRVETASASRRDSAELASLALRNGRTSRTASCHNPRSPRGPAMSFVRFTPRRLTILDQNDMETPGPVRTQFDVLLDIRRARRTSDEIYGPRQSFRLCGDSQAVPAIFVGRDHLVAADHRDMGLRRPWPRTTRPASARRPQLRGREPSFADALRRGRVIPPPR